MFERYTEKARRVIFFARYEASQLGSPVIAAEHLLLGLLRENKYILVNILKLRDEDTLRAQIEANRKTQDPPLTHADLPLNDDSKHILKFAAEEADRLNHRHIGTEHLLLGIAREKNSYAAKLLNDHNFDPQKFREGLLKPSPAIEAAFAVRPLQPYTPHVVASHISRALEDISIHGQPRNADYIRRSVKKLREVAWHWRKADWTSRDIVIHRKTQSISFDTRLAEDQKHFELIKNGWGKDYCKICHWELYPATDDPDHATGYTNGRDWLCTECYDKFIARSDFFSSNYPDIT